MSYFDTKCRDYFYENVYFNTVMVCIQLFMTKSCMCVSCYLNCTTSALTSNLEFCLHILMNIISNSEITKWPFLT